MRARHQQLGMHGYVPYLRMFVDRPTTVADLVASGLGVTASNRITKALHAMRMVHIAEWVVVPNCPLRAAFRFGNFPDAQIEVRRPTGRAPVRREPDPCRLPIWLIGLRSAIAALQTPGTAIEIAERAAMSRGAARAVLRALLEARLIYVASWRIQSIGGSHTALYKFGVDMKDAAKPDSSQRAREACQRQRKRERAAMALHLQQLAANASVFAWRPAA